MHGWTAVGSSTAVAQRCVGNMVNVIPRKTKWQATYEKEAGPTARVAHAQTIARNGRPDDEVAR